MQKMLLVLVVPLLAIALAVSAVAVVPSMLTALAPGSTSSMMQTAAPSWKVGDSWTYNISFGLMGDAAVMPREMIVQAQPDGSMVLGTLTETVVGTASTEYGPAWNVTENITLLIGHPVPVTGPEPVMQSLCMPSVAASGFVWYRQSDLAPVYAFKSVHMGRIWNVTGPTGTSTLDHMFLNGTYSLTYDATTQVWFHPTLKVLQFPLTENTSYNVSSNETIHYWSSFRVLGPNSSYGTDHYANFTVPINFTMRTGLFENVTTPGGTFRALQVSAYRELFTAEIPDRDASAMVNLTDAPCTMMMSHAFASAWFSDQVGNVVKADVGMGGFNGPRIELTLVSYTYG
jgi:hypothetical protein